MEDVAIEMASGRAARPARNGENPSVCCVCRLRKNTMGTMAMLASAMPTVAEASVGLRKIHSGIICPEKKRSTAR